jgi:hypothetical protein
MVLDWFYWTALGNLDIDRSAYPDPKGMNAQLNAMGMRSLISVWPRFEKVSKNFDTLAAKGWLLHDKDGKPVDGLPIRSDRAGALIDPTVPAARKWFWSQIRDNILSQGFDWTWLDETEPDLVPDGYFYSIGSGDRYHNLFPLLHPERGGWFGAGPAGQAQHDPVPRGLSRRAAQWLPVLVERRGRDLGSLAAPDSHRHQCDCVGHDLLEQRHRWLAVAGWGW